MQIQIGKEYVVASSTNTVNFVPIRCNSQFSPEHPCRVKIEKVGRKYAYAKISGYKGLQSFAFKFLHEIETAKELYRQALVAGKRTPELIKECIEKL